LSPLREKRDRDWLILGKEQSGVWIIGFKRGGWGLGLLFLRRTGVLELQLLKELLKLLEDGKLQIPKGFVRNWLFAA
jgi:hypothetical protein